MKSRLLESWRFQDEKKMKLAEFKIWLARQGAEVLAVTNPYEVLRFRAKAAVHVVYTGRRGTTLPIFVTQCLTAFEMGTSMDMGLVAVARSFGAKFRAAIVERDGRGCFFCLNPMREDDMTLEHLVPVSKGGPNHMDNMVLAHQACNQRADDQPLIEKIKMRENAMRGVLGLEVRS